MSKKLLFNTSTGNLICKYKVSEPLHNYIKEIFNVYVEDGNVSVYPRIARGDGFYILSYYSKRPLSRIEPIYSMYDFSHVKFDFIQVTDNVTDMSYWFSLGMHSSDGIHNELKEIKGMDLWDTSNVTTMMAMFDNCNISNLDTISNWNTSKVEDMRHMFEGCSSLETLDISSWDTSNVMYMDEMFRNCSSLRSLNMSGWDMTRVGNISYYKDSQGYQIQKLKYMFANCSSLESLNLSGWKVCGDFRDEDYYNSYKMSTFIKCNKVTVDVRNWEFVDDGVNNARRIVCMFKSLPATASVIGLDSWNTSVIKDMSYMFENCVCLKSDDLKEWNVSNVTTMESMFEGCTSLQTLDISGLNSSQNAYTCKMFAKCNNLISLNARDWDTSNVIDMSNMFANCSNLSNIEGIDRWVVSNVGNNEYDNWDADMFCMFEGCSSLETLDINSWDMSNVRSTVGMFCNCTSLKSLPLIGRWNTSNVRYMDQMFDGCSSLVFEFSDFISHWDTSNVMYMNAMFRNCSSLETLDISNWDMSKVADITEMFKGCSSLTNIYWNPNFNIGTLMNGVFEGCSSLTSISVNNINTNDVREMSRVFKGCSSLETLNISSWDMSNVTTMESMFEGCTSLTYVSADGINIPYQNPGINIKIRNLNCMFKNCTSLTSIDISKLHTNLATITAHSMFEGCTSLESLKINMDALFYEEDCIDIFKDCDSLDSVTVIQDGNYVLSHSILNLTHLLPDRTSMTSGTVEIPSIYDSKAFESAMNAIREKNWEIIFR